MITVNNQTTFFIACPPNIATGGPMLLHQLAHVLNSKGYKALMYYYSEDVSKLNDPIHANYKKFNIPFVTSINDNKENILIIPEVSPEFIYTFKNIQKVIWWLSVDNFIDIHEKPNSRFSVKSFLGIKPKKVLYKFENEPKHSHWAQSYYAIDFLKSKNVENISFLSDYLEDIFLKEAEQIDLENVKKEDIIAYNPKKGFEITSKLIELRKDLNWVAIENMTPTQVKELLLKAKIYIDFGHHPGKDRIPREAATLGCIVITNKKGSAKFYEDVPIDEKYKFDNVIKSSSAFFELVSNIYEKYPEHLDSFKFYRDFIFNEEKKFQLDLEGI